jgi:hypothetical protein
MSILEAESWGICCGVCLEYYFKDHIVGRIKILMKEWDKFGSGCLNLMWN